jgi:hypothetical protein
MESLLVQYEDIHYLERASTGDTAKMAATIVVMIDSFIVGKEKETIDNALSDSACQLHSLRSHFVEVSYIGLGLRVPAKFAATCIFWFEALEHK